MSEETSTVPEPPAPFELAMFPLGTVLVPHQHLALHIFEPRYQAMITHVLSGRGGQFGVVGIIEGSEVGGGEVRRDVGTVAHVVDATPVGNGRWNVMAVGRQRVRVSRWLPDAPFPRAEVTEIPERPWPGTEEANATLQRAEREVGRALALASELGEHGLLRTRDLSDEPSVRLWELVSALQLPADLRFSLLTETDPVARAAALGGAARATGDLLAKRLAGG